MNTSNLIEQEMLYNIQLGRISNNAFPEKFKSTKSSISRPTQDMINDYNEQFKRPFEREVLVDGNMVKQKFKYDVPDFSNTLTNMDDVAALEAARTITDSDAGKVNTEIEKQTKVYNDSNKKIKK